MKTAGTKESSSLLTKQRLDAVENKKMHKHSKRGTVKLEEEKANGMRIHTLCLPVDKLLGGDGIKRGTLTEVVGLPGVGKTTFCLQLCVNVQIPESLSGCDGQAIYIGTDHSLCKKRLSQIAGEFVNRTNAIMRKKLKIPNHFTLEGVLSKIHIARCCDIADLVKILMSLENFLDTNTDVKLVVIDSIAYPMFTQGEQFSKRVKILYNIAQLLLPLMTKHGVAVVITNSLTTRFNEANDYFVPYLGESWSFIPNQTLKFTHVPSERYRVAELVKSSFYETGTANFRIIHQGFRE